MEKTYYPEVTPSVPNLPPYNQQPPPAYGPGPPAVPIQHQPYYAPYSAMPSQGPIIQPVQNTTIILPTQPVYVPDYLCYSIFTMLFCCLPLGIAALVFSIQTQNANHAGNTIEARRNSRLARNLAHAALGTGILLATVLSVVIMAIQK